MSDGEIVTALEIMYRKSSFKNSLRTHFGGMYNIRQLLTRTRRLESLTGFEAPSKVTANRSVVSIDSLLRGCRQPSFCIITLPWFLLKYTEVPDKNVNLSQ